LQAGGRGFESHRLHHHTQDVCGSGLRWPLVGVESDEPNLTIAERARGVEDRYAGQASPTTERSNRRSRTISDKVTWARGADTVSGAQIDTLSVLFTDVVGSTELRAALGEDAADLERRAHDEVLTAAVTVHAGTVVKGLGDGILATFKSAAEAVAAAIDMQQAVELRGRIDPGSRPGFEPVSIRIGISVGDVSCEGGDVFGAPVVEASRLCGIATGGEILVADLVRALSRGRGGFGFEPMGVIELKGIADPVAACRVVWVPLEMPTSTIASPSPIPPLLEASAVAGYVGREEVLQSLRDAWADAASGGARAILLSGEPGIGKTRTASELARVAHASGAVVLYGRCDEDLGVPYQPFVEALDYYTETVAAPELGRLPGELTRLVPEIRTRIDSVPDAVRSDPRSEEHRLLEATSSWLVAASRPSGLVLVLDDLHWATKPTLLLLLHLLRAAAAEPEPARLLVLGTYRDTDIDRSHPLSGLMGELRRVPGVARIGLDGLTSEEITMFLAQQAGHELDASALPLAEALHVETEGNPFFMAEVLRHLVEVGQVRRQGERWVVADPEHLAVPEGVRDVVGRRLSRLSERANTVLGVAAVVGREVQLEVLTNLVDADEDDVVDALDEAVRARLLEEVGADHYRFGHALVRTTLYDELSATRRRRLHRRVADVLEKLRPDDVVVLAYHAVEAGPEGGDMHRAVHYTMAAADQALQSRAVAEAEVRYRHVLEILEDGYEDDDPTVIAALIGLGRSQRDQGDADFRITLQTAGRRAVAGGHTELLVEAVLADHRGLASIVSGVDDDRVELTERALEAVGDDGTPDRARLLAHLAGELSFAGDDARRLGLSDEARALAQELEDPALVTWVTIRSGYALFSPRRTPALVRDLAAVVAQTDESDDPALQAQARFWYSGALLSAGEIDAAMATLEEARLGAEHGGVPHLGWAVDAISIWVLIARGDIEAAARRNDENLALGQRIGAPDAVQWWQAITAPMAHVTGESGSLADASGAFADQYPAGTEWRAAHAWWLAVDGRIAAAQGVLRDHPIDPVLQVDRPFPLHTLVELAWVAHFTEDRALAEDVEQLLLPFEGQWAHYFAASLGPVVLAIGLTAAVRGELDLALDRLEAGIAVLRRYGFDALAIGYDERVAAVLVRRDHPGDLARAVSLLETARTTARRHGLEKVEQRLSVTLSELA
jgi:class 3 adenylate cyclase